MKKIILISIISTFISFLNYSCKDDSPTKNCQSTNSACGTFTTCCTPTQCYYEYNGQRYNCNGTDCSDAATQLASIMCSSKIDDSEPCITVEELLLSVPCANGNLGTK
jgi:hypothetical protein